LIFGNAPHSQAVNVVLLAEGFTMTFVFSSTTATNSQSSFCDAVLRHCRLAEEDRLRGRGEP
jgi:hypothetical protein